MASVAPQNFVALQRFGLGARPGDLSAIAGDPRGAVLAEIAPDAALIADPDLPDTAGALTAISDIQKARKSTRKAPAEAMDEMDAMEDNASPAMEPAKGKPAGRKQRKSAADAARGNPLLDELAARMAQAQRAPIGFAERWAMFWSNHFAIEADSNQLVRWAAGAYDREAIRPNVFGRFDDLLLAATQHPAMLRYLNNATSIGPGSKAGQKRDKGLNENHARELMELHTIGVDAGYTQADVTALAKILTGWSFGANPAQKNFARFAFNGAAHEPGPQTVLGAVYDQRGVEQGMAVLGTLAAHEATATHIARKLVHAFVADAPPEELVATLATRFLDTGGDLAELARTLVSSELAWSAPLQKLRLPQDYVFAASRALAVTPKAAAVNKALMTLGQPLFNPPSPEGFHDDAATWLAPDAMTNRLDLAEGLAQLADSSADARAVADTILGDAQSAATREAIARAEGPVQGLTILLMSPEFQRR